MAPRTARWIGLLILPALACSRAGDPIKGLAPRPAGDGPTVVWDVYAQPVPNIPLPNDLATVPDPSTPTGKRLNISASAPTRFEQRLRAHFNELDGFGVYAPITVSFTDRLDIPALESFHRDHDFSNDAVYLIALDTGEPVEIDFGRGNFPWTLWQTDNYYVNDSRGACVTLLVDCVEEDTNGNGVLDPGEDTDADGLLDHPNNRSNTGRPYDDVLPYYDLNSNTLIIQPVVPLREATVYAVVLTNRLRGGNGSAVRSPFPIVNHAMQTEALRPLPTHLRQWGLAGDDVAFTWSFTTGSVTRDLLAIRDGLYGKGPFKELQDRYKPEVATVVPLVNPSSLPKDRALNVHTIPAESIARIVGAASEQFLTPEVLGDATGALAQVAGVLAAFSFKNVDYFVAGEYISPDLRDSVCPDDPAYEPYADHAFKLDYALSRARHIPCTVPFFAAVPKKRSGPPGPPFPVVLNAHGTGLGQVLTVLIDADAFARFGIVTIGIPSPSAMTLPFMTGSTFEPLVRALFKPVGLEAMITAGFGRGRGVDLTGDGTPDTAGDMYSADAFKTRDNIRQTIVDHFQLVRVLRAFDGTTRWNLDLNGDGEKELAGDFNADGIVDFGGPDVSTFATGASQGGLVSAVLTAVEPYIIAAAPDAPPGGFYSEAGMRSGLRILSDIAFIEAMGPLIVGTRAPSGKTLLSHNAVTPDLLSIAGSGINFDLSQTDNLISVAGVARVDTLLTFAEVSDLSPGVTVTAHNLSNGQSRSDVIRADGTFRIGLPSDQGDLWEIRYRPAGTAEDTVINTTSFSYKHRRKEYAAGSPLQAPHFGVGYSRGSKEFRQLVFLGQMGFDWADPVSYAPLYRLRPPGNTPGARLTPNVLLIPTTGDGFAVVSGEISIARAAGFIPIADVDPRLGLSPNDYLISNYVMEGIPFLRFGGSTTRPQLFDPDVVSFGLDGFDVPRSNPPLRLTIQTDTGVSGVRFSYPAASGSHTSLIGGGKYNGYLDIKNRMAYYFYTGGKVILDDPCLGAGTCSQFPP